MDYDAFTGGVEPGGLRNKSEIKILICYLLASVDAPLSREDIITIIQDNGLANYFETVDALSELAESGNLFFSGENSGFCCASDKGKMIAKQLDRALPPVVRTKAVSAAINLLAKAKRESENKVEILPAERGFHVICHISGGTMELMSFSLYVPDRYQAEMVKKQFQQSPETVYRMLLALVTGNDDMAAEILKSKNTN